MYEGIVDYLDIMRLAGVSELKKPVRRVAPPNGSTSVAPVQEQSDVSPLVEPVHGSKNSLPLPLGEGTTVAAARLPSHGSKAEQLRCLAEEVAKCTQCKDLASSRTQTVFGTGNPESFLVFIGEAPGADEDKRGEPFVGRAGQLLTDIITKGMRIRREDVYICNILRCRPPGNRNPMPDEAAHCRSFLDRTLEIIQPKYICCLGTVAAKHLLSTDQTIGAMRGKVWDCNGIKVVCTYHPAYLLRNPAAKKDTWDDIQLLMREMEMK